MDDLLIGRDAVLADVRQGLLRGPVLLQGPPGIGKSALLRAVAADQPAALVLRGVAVLGSVPYLPVRVARPSLELAGSAGAVADRLVAGTLATALVAIDDLQWCDPDTLALIEELSYRRPLLAAVRAEPGPADALVAGLSAIGTVLRVGALDPDAARALVRALRPSVSEPDLQRLVEGAQGLPLDLVLAATGGPDGAQVLTDALAQLDGETLELLARVSVAGTALAIADPSIDVLERAGLVVRVGEEQYRPRHDLVARGAMDALAPVRLRALHAAQAEHEVDPAARAVHLAEAGRLDEAAEAAALAVDLAPSPSSRAEFLRLQAVCTRPASSDLVIEAADALSRTGRYDEAIALLADHPGTGDGLAGATVRARANWAISGIDEVRLAIEQGLAAAGADWAALPDADADQVAELLALRSRILCRVDWELAEAIAVAEQGVAVAPGPGPGLLAARAALGLAQLMTGDLRWAEELEDAGRLAVAEVDLHNAVTIYDALFFGHLLSGFPDRCAVLAAEAVAATELTSAAWNGYFRSVSLLAVIHALGDHRTVLAESDLLARRPLTVKSREAARTARVFALLDAGRDLDAVELAERAVAEGSDDSARSTGAWGLAESAWLAGEPERALDAALASLDLNVSGFPGPVNAAVLGLWATRELGLEFDPRLVAATASGFANLAAAVTEAEALVAERDDPARASSLFEAAADDWARANVRASLRARWGAFEAARIAGDPATAERHLRILEAEAERLQIAWLRRRVAAGLRGAGLRRAPGTPRHATAGTEVLARVARGQTTVAISRALAITSATVEGHIREAMRRTGASTRVHAAVLATAAGPGAGLVVVEGGDGSVQVRSRVLPDAAPRVSVGELAPTPWLVPSPVIVTGTVQGEPDLVAAVLAVARGAALDIAVPPDREAAVHALLAGLRQLGVPVGEPERRDLALDAEDARLVALIAEGRTVVEAATELGYSRRTVQRRLAAIRVALGTASNREAVVRAR